MDSIFFKKFKVLIYWALIFQLTSIEMVIAQPRARSGSFPPPPPPKPGTGAISTPGCVKRLVAQALADPQIAWLLKLNQYDELLKNNHRISDEFRALVNDHSMRPILVHEMEQAKRAQSEGILNQIRPDTLPEMTPREYQGSFDRFDAYGNLEDDLLNPEAQIYDVLIYGGGVHDAIVANRLADSDLKFASIERTNMLGGTPRRLGIAVEMNSTNRRSLPRGENFPNSGNGDLGGQLNEIPGGAVQVDDVAPENWSTLRDLGEAITINRAVHEAPVFFKQDVVDQFYIKTPSNVAEKLDNAPEKLMVTVIQDVETKEYRFLYSQAVLDATGSFGKPKLTGKFVDERTLISGKLEAREVAKTPNLFHYEDLMSLVNESMTPFRQFVGKTIAVVGEGDSGKTALEFFGRLSRGRTYGRDLASIGNIAPSKWCGPNAKTCGQWIVVNRVRYSRVSGLIKGGIVENVPGRVKSITRTTDNRFIASVKVPVFEDATPAFPKVIDGEPRPPEIEQLYVDNKTGLPLIDSRELKQKVVDGEPVFETRKIELDAVVMATGYEDNSFPYIRRLLARNKKDFDGNPLPSDFKWGSPYALPIPGEVSGIDPTTGRKITRTVSIAQQLLGAPVYAIGTTAKGLVSPGETFGVTENVASIFALNNRTWAAAERIVKIFKPAFPPNAYTRAIPVPVRSDHFVGPRQLLARAKGVARGNSELFDVTRTLPLELADDNFKSRFVWEMAQNGRLGTFTQARIMNHLARFDYQRMRRFNIVIDSNPRLPIKSPDGDNFTIATDPPLPENQLQQLQALFESDHELMSAIRVQIGSVPHDDSFRTLANVASKPSDAFQSGQNRIVFNMRLKPKKKAKLRQLYDAPFSPEDTTLVITTRNPTLATRIQSSLLKTGEISKKLKDEVKQNYDAFQKAVDVRQFKSLDSLDSPLSLNNPLFLRSIYEYNLYALLKVINKRTSDSERALWGVYLAVVPSSIIYLSALVDELTSGGSFDERKPRLPWTDPVFDAASSFFDGAANRFNNAGETWRELPKRMQERQLQKIENEIRAYNERQERRAQAQREDLISSHLENSQRRLRDNQAIQDKKKRKGSLMRRLLFPRKKRKPQ